MIVSKELYDKMVLTINLAIQENRYLTIKDSRKLNVSYDTLVSLFSQFFLRLNKMQIKANDIETILQRTKNGESIFSLVQEFQVSGYRMSKIYLERTLGNNVKMADFLKHPLIVQDPKIRSDLLLSISIDKFCSPVIDNFKEISGHFYEELLQQLLKAKHMSFETEEDLKRKGRSRTPDIYFTIPMATLCNKREKQMMAKKHKQPFSSPESPVARKQALSPAKQLFSNDSTLTILDTVTKDSQEYNPTAESEYLIVNWIDSKAMFADRETFADQLDQFQSYYHRLGRGMVIYWHGFTEDLYDDPLLNCSHVIIRDSFPEDWIFPTGEMATHELPTFLKESPKTQP